MESLARSQPLYSKPFRGLNAFGAQSPKEPAQKYAIGPLEKGPAYGQIENRKSQIENHNDQFTTHFNSYPGVQWRQPIFALPQSHSPIYQKRCIQCNNGDQTNSTLRLHHLAANHDKAKYNGQRML